MSDPLMCPECRYEYVPGIVVCPECLVDLVAPGTSAAPDVGSPGNQPRGSVLTLDDNGEWVTVGGTAGVVTSLGIDAQMLFVTADGLVVTVGEQAVVRAGGVATPVFPTRAEVGPFIDLLWRSLEEVRVFKVGRLELDFSDGYSLVVPEGQDMEQWSIEADDGTRIQLFGQGSVVVWPPGSPEGYDLASGTPAARRETPFPSGRGG